MPGSVNFSNFFPYTESNMLGKHVLSDLEIRDLRIPTQIPWGTETFQSILQSPTSDISILKQRQLALFALRHKESTNQCTEVREKLASLTKAVTIVEELGAPLDSRIQDSIEQIYWSPTSMLSFLNSYKYVVAFLVFWKTLVLPTVAVLVPFLAIVIPFFLIRFLHGIDIAPSTYMSQLRGVLLKQVSVPAILRAKHDGDFVGYLLESGFLLLTGATYVSSIWSQVTASMHLRGIALDIQEKGETVETLIKTFRGILETLYTLPPRLQTALQPFLLRGEAVIAEISEIPLGCGYRTYGYVWMHAAKPLNGLKAWIGELDAMLGIVGIQEIAFPIYKGPLVIEGVYHPSLETRIPNTVAWSQSHAILTGPNRGGKSTLCRAIGVSLMCAQSWGFAFAARMSFEPFEAIETALHPADTLGELSLFEAEIEFAKEVLAVAKKSRTFVMMDEIFHSTNAVDGLAASRVFLSQLFAIPQVHSLISTHYKELPEEYKVKAAAWAMEATEGADGLVYSYKKVDGISDKSSVMEILRERGLVLD
jgi:hypothetical protein